jgi:putative flippase GtrA
MISSLANVPRYFRYVAVSAAALGVDMALFLTLIAGGVLATLASGLGYCLGIFVHWFLSSRFVFGAQLADNGAARTKQKGLFVGSALLGLGLTMLIVGVSAAAGFDPRAAKIVAIAVSFNVTYLLRKVVVFA